MAEKKPSVLTSSTQAVLSAQTDVLDGEREIGLQKTAVKNTRLSAVRFVEALGKYKRKYGRRARKHYSLESDSSSPPRLIEPCPQYCGEYPQNLFRVYMVLSPRPLAPRVPSKHIVVTPFPSRSAFSTHSLQHSNIPSPFPLHRPQSSRSLMNPIGWVFNLSRTMVSVPFFDTFVTY